MINALETSVGNTSSILATLQQISLPSSGSSQLLSKAFADSVVILCIFSKKSTLRFQKGERESRVIASLIPLSSYQYVF